MDPTENVPPEAVELLVEHDPGPLASHPRRAAIEKAIREGQRTNGWIAQNFGVRGIDGSDAGPGVHPEEVVRRHRLAIMKPPERPHDHVLAHDWEPAVVPVPDGVFEGVPWGNAGSWVHVANFAGKVGPSGRHVGFGDLLAPDEVGNGVSHGTALRLPANRGVVGLLRAVLARNASLEELILSGDADALKAEAKRLRKQAT